MSFKRTIVIAVLFLILGGLYYHFQIKEKPKKEEAKQKENAVFSIKGENVTKLILKRYPEEFAFEKKDYEWFMTAPGSYKADTAVVGNIMQITAALQKAEVVDEKPTDLKQYGLEIPKYELTLTDGKASQTIQLGIESIGSKYLYAKMSDSPQVFLVDSGIGFSLKGNTASFRDKAVFAVKPENVEKTAVYCNGATYMFEFRDGKWTLTQPPVPRADDEMAASYIMALLQLNCKNFIADTPVERKRVGLDKSDDYVEVYEKGSKQPIVLKFAIPEKKEQSVYAVNDNSGEILELAPTTSDILAVNKEKLIKKSLFDFEVDKLKEVTFKWDGNEAIVQQQLSQAPKGDVQQSAWNMIAPEKKGLENQDMFGIIANIRNLYIRDAFFLENSPGKFGLDKPILTVTGKRDDGKVHFTLTVGSVSQDPGFYYVRANDENTVEIAQKETIDNLIKDLNKVLGKEKPSQGGKTTK